MKGWAVMKQRLARETGSSHQVVSEFANLIKRSDELTKRFNFYLDLLGEDEVARGIASIYKEFEHPTFHDLETTLTGNRDQKR